MEEDFDPYGIGEYISKPVIIAIFAVIFTGIAVYFLVRIFRRRYCDQCGLRMKMDYNDGTNEIIRVCPKCGAAKGTGIYGGSD
ncbi:hypothetical protein [uncultured Flavobacterium sp.]|uniref:hypothetical protein n=1 Tax=uncultured Flavobacterium sp. TaxID=165435 RepID=UPI0025E9F745|nr:hypothetical protein [uncultured Flavobacterium sp.]